MLETTDFKPFFLRKSIRFLTGAIVGIFLIIALMLTVFFHFRVYREPVLSIENIAEEYSEGPSFRKKPSPNVYQKIHTSRQNNDEFMGWIEIPGTIISEGVFKSTDNVFYKNHDASRRPNFSGAVFMDYRNEGKNRSTISNNIFIYGNYISIFGDYYKKEKFSHLLNFTSLNFAQENQYITYSTTEDEMSFEIFSVIYTSAEKFEKDYMIEGRLSVEKLTKGSLYAYPTTVLESDKLILLSTSYYNTPGEVEERFVVVARLMEPDEKTTLKEVVVNSEK